MATPRTQPGTSARQMSLPSRSRCAIEEQLKSFSLPPTRQRLPTHTVPSSATAVREGIIPWLDSCHIFWPVSVLSWATWFRLVTAM
jgi:hypothetical protein